MPNILQDGCPGCNTNTCADQHGDFIFEDVLGGGTIGPVNTQFWHGLAVLQSNFVHSVRIEAFKILRLSGTTAEGVSQCAGKISNLADMYTNVRVERT